MVCDYVVTYIMLGVLRWVVICVYWFCWFNWLRGFLGFRLVCDVDLFWVLIVLNIVLIAWGLIGWLRFWFGLSGFCIVVLVW